MPSCGDNVGAFRRRITVPLHNLRRKAMAMGAILNFASVLLLLVSCRSAVSAFTSVPSVVRVRVSGSPTDWRGIAAASDAAVTAASADGVQDSFTHADIEWRLRPQKGTPLLKRLSLRCASSVIKLDCKIRRKEPPPVLCPKGGQSVLQAYHRPKGSLFKKQIARFGFSTVRGPAAPPIDETITELYDIQQFPLGGVGVAAIIYMFVEEEYRKCGIGKLALEAISAIHSVQGCDFTVLVADDDGSGKLIEWYIRNGFSRAPKLQEMMGSPNGKYGITMIAPTSLPSDFFSRCRIRW